jgi:hypothetical protein
MKITIYRHENVPSNERGLSLDGSVKMSHPDGGCGSQGCNCSPGFWLSIVMPRTVLGEVAVVKVKFDDKAEFHRFLDVREIDGPPREQHKPKHWDWANAVTNRIPDLVAVHRAYKRGFRRGLVIALLGSTIVSIIVNTFFR